MSVVKLDPNVRKKIEAELKAKIPTPDEAAFEGFLESLSVTHPELHRELLLGLSVVKMPAEKEATKVLRRTRVRKLFDNLFFLTKWPESRVLDKKRVVYAGLGVLAVLLPVAYLLSSGNLPLSQEQIYQPAEHADTSDGGNALGSVSYANLNPEPENPSATLATQLFSDTRETPQPTEIPASIPDTSTRGITPFPRDLPPPVTSPAPLNTVGPSRDPSSRPIGEWPADAQLPTRLSVVTPSQSPRSLTVWQQTPASGFGESLTLPNGFEVADRSRPQLQTTTVFERENQTLPLTVNSLFLGEETAVANGSAGLPNQRIGLTVFRQQAPEIQSLSVSTLDEGRQASDLLQHLTVQTETGPTPVLEPNETPASNDRPTLDTPQSSQGSVETVLQPGTRLAATLSTGITVTDRSSNPVVAETKGNWCSNGMCPAITWIGTARLLSNSRIEVAFTEAIVGTEPRPVSAVALGDDEMVGLKAATQDAASDVAQALLQSAAGGVSDYLEALISQKQITFQDGAVIQEGQVPGIGTFILGRFADLISPPAPPTERVKLAMIPAGAAFTILYGVQLDD